MLLHQRRPIASLIVMTGMDAMTMDVIVAQVWATATVSSGMAHPEPSIGLLMVAVRTIAILRRNIAIRTTGFHIITDTAVTTEGMILQPMAKKLIR